MTDTTRTNSSPLSVLTAWLRRPWVDIAATSVSLLCLLHCIVPPLLILLFPLLAYEIELPEYIHVVLLAAAIPLSLIALRQGLKDHGKVLLVVLGVLGQGLVAFGVLSESVPVLETGLTVVGVSIVALVHLLNWHIRRRKTAQARASSVTGEGVATLT